MQPTNYTDINRLLDRLLSQMHRALGEELVGLYLYGSLVTGDFDLAISDIDLLVAITSDIDEGEAESLQAMHRAIAHDNPEWDDRIEVAYLSTMGLQTFRTQRSKLAIISPGEPFHIIEAGSDWLMNWYMVRTQGVTLFGQAPEEIIDPITKEEFIQSVREHVRGWSDWIDKAQKRKAQAYAILTMCRSLYTVQYGEQVSKRRAALWVQQELPEWSELIGNALLWRAALDDEQEDHKATYQTTIDFVHMVRNRIIN